MTLERRLLIAIKALRRIAAGDTGQIFPGDVAERALREVGDTWKRKGAGKSMGPTHNSVSPEDRSALVKYINRTPALLSALYDLNLLPEQLEVGSDTELWMLRLAGMFLIGVRSAKAEATAIRTAIETIETLGAPSGVPWRESLERMKATPVMCPRCGRGDLEPGGVHQCVPE